MSAGRILADLDLRTEGVRLRPLRVEDAEAGFALLAGRSEILEWLEWSGPRSVEDLRAQARAWRTTSDAGANYGLAIVLPRARADAPDQLVGGMSLRFVDHPERGDLGYWIGVEHQRRGLASAAVGLMPWLAFEVLEAQLLAASVFVDNQASRRVLEKNGFALCKSESLPHPFSSRPRWNFALSADSWRASPSAQRPSYFELAFCATRP